MAMPVPSVSRRHLLGAAGVTAIGVGLGTVMAPVAHAAIPESTRVNVAANSVRMFLEKMLHESNHVMQGMAVDSANQRLFIAQIRNGSDGNDLCINCLSYSGAVVGHMHLDNAGHGVSIGVEPVGTASYLWVENKAGSGDRGTALARFKYVNGGAPSWLTYFDGWPGPQITCDVDPVHDTIMIRYLDGERAAYSVYDLSLVKERRYTEAFLAKQPMPYVQSGSVFQSYTHYGRYGYMIEGPSQNVTDPQDLKSMISAFDLETGQVVQRAHTYAAYTLLDREPEGIAIATVNGQLRVMYGLASHKSDQGIKRYATVYYKA